MGTVYRHQNILLGEANKQACFSTVLVGACLATCVWSSDGGSENRVNRVLLGGVSLPRRVRAIFRRKGLREHVVFVTKLHLIWVHRVTDL